MNPAYVAQEVRRLQIYALSLDARLNRLVAGSGGEVDLPVDPGEQPIVEGTYKIGSGVFYVNGQYIIPYRRMINSDDPDLRNAWYLYFLTSKDAKSWKVIKTDWLSNAWWDEYEVMYYQNNTWLYLNAGYMLSSTDLEHWVNNTPKEVSAKEISFKYATDGNGRWVAGNYYKENCVSLDGITWTVQPDDDAAVDGVVYCSGYFLRITINKIIQYSSDGLAWHDTEITDAYVTRRGICTNGQIVYAAGPYCVYYTTDPAGQWSNIPMETTNPIIFYAADIKCFVSRDYPDRDNCLCLLSDDGQLLDRIPKIDSYYEYHCCSDKGVVITPSRVYHIVDDKFNEVADIDRNEAAKTKVFSTSGIIFKVYPWDTYQILTSTDGIKWSPVYVERHPECPWW